MFEWLLNLFSKKRRIEYKNTTIKKKLFKNFKNCHYCGEQLYSLDDASLDHMTPLSKGGLNEIENCTISCKKCNIMKEDSEYNLFKGIVTDISKREIYWKYYEQRINHNIRIDIMFPHLKEKEKEYRNLIKIHNLSKDRLVKIYGLKHKRVKDIDSKIGNINKELYNIRNKIREIKKNLDKCYND